MVELSNKNVFSDRLNREDDKSAFLKSDGKLFQALVAPAAKSCPQNRWIYLVDSQRSRVKLSTKHSYLARASVTSWQS